MSPLFQVWLSKAQTCPGWQARGKVVGVLLCDGPRRCVVGHGSCKLFFFLSRELHVCCLLCMGVQCVPRVCNTRVLLELLTNGANRLYHRWQFQLPSSPKRQEKGRRRRRAGKRRKQVFSEHFAEVWDGPVWTRPECSLQRTTRIVLHAIRACARSRA